MAVKKLQGLMLRGGSKIENTRELIMWLDYLTLYVYGIKSVVLHKLYS